MSITGNKHVARFSPETPVSALLAHSLREKSREVERVEKEAQKAIASRPGIAAFDEDKGWLATFGQSVLYRSHEFYIRGTGEDARDMQETYVQAKFDRLVEEEAWDALKAWEDAEGEHQRTAALTGTYGGNLPIVLRQAGDELVYVRVGSPGNRTLMTVMGLWDEKPRHVPVSELSIPHLPFTGMKAEASFLEKVCPAGAIVHRDGKSWIKVQSGWMYEGHHYQDALLDGVYLVRMFADFS